MGKNLDDFVVIEKLLGQQQLWGAYEAFILDGLVFINEPVTKPSSWVEEEKVC